MRSTEIEPGLAQRLRARTAKLHACAEQHGIVAAILARTVTTAGYAVYLRNLLPAYLAMEEALHQHRDRAGIGFFAHAALLRADPIAADLRALAGPDWRDTVPLLPISAIYAERIAWASRNGVDRLVGHAYTRYLGDLNGGQTIRRHLLRLFGDDFPAVAFTSFPAIAGMRSFVADFRAALDKAGEYMPDPEPAIEEAETAFGLNIRLSDDVAAYITQATETATLIAQIVDRHGHWRV